MTALLSEPGQPTHIECYSGSFPANDPQSAAAYAEILKGSFELSVPEFATGEAFSASTEIFVLPDITVSWAKVSASRLTRTIRTVAAHGTDQILVNCYVSGHFDMTAAGETKRVVAGELAFIDLSQEVSIATPRVDTLSLAISRRKLEAMVPFLDAAHGYVRPPDSLSKLVRAMMQEIVAVGPRLQVVDARGVAAAVLQLVAACLEPLSRRSIDGGRNTVSLVAIKGFIEHHLLETALGPQILLDTFGITRSTLYRLFEPVGGVSAYIAQRKLNHAFRLLSDTRERGRISKLAVDLGYSHPSAFTRAFKEAFGLSPKDVQALAEQSREQEVQLRISPAPMQYLTPIAIGSREMSKS